MHRIQKQYFKEIRRLLPCSSAEKKQHLADLEPSVDAFITARPDVTLAQLYDQFGSPQTIAESYLEQRPDQVSRKMSLKPHIVCVCIVIVLVLSVGIFAATKYISDKIDDVQEGYFIDEIEDYSSPRPTPVVIGEY